MKGRSSGARTGLLMLDWRLSQKHGLNLDGFRFG